MLIKFLVINIFIIYMMIVQDDGVVILLKNGIKKNAEVENVKNKTKDFQKKKLGTWLFLLNI
jgi:hypothetical protein